MQLFIFISGYITTFISQTAHTSVCDSSVFSSLYSTNNFFFLYYGKSTLENDDADDNNNHFFRH